MKRYGQFDTMQELIEHNKPLMKVDRQLREERRKARGIKSEINLEEEKDEKKRKHLEEMLSLLYAMENMPRE